MWFKVIVFAVLLTRLKSFNRHRLSAWRPRRRLMMEIVVPGSALGLQQLIRSSLFSFVLLVIGSASVTGLAATSAALSLYRLLSIPAIGLATAVTVVVGQGFASGGTALANQVIRRSLFVGGVVAVTLSAFMLLFPKPLLQISLGGLSPEDRDTIQPLAITLLRYAAIYCLADVASLLLGAAAKGIGRAFILLIATAIPGTLAVAVGWCLSPEGTAAATHWWSVLIAWAFVQAAIIAMSISPFGFPTKQRS